MNAAAELFLQVPKVRPWDLRQPTYLQFCTRFQTDERVPPFRSSMTHSLAAGLSTLAWSPTSSSMKTTEDASSRSRGSPSILPGEMLRSLAWSVEFVGTVSTIRLLVIYLDGGCS